MEQNLKRIVYCSHCAISDRKAAVDATRDVIRASRSNNPRQGISGALLSNADYYAQVLEGPIEAVERTYQTIIRDDRHYGMVVLLNEPVHNRAFPSWSMAYAAPERGTELVTQVLENALTAKTKAAGNDVAQLIFESVERAMELQEFVRSLVDKRRSALHYV